MKNIIFIAAAIVMLVACTQSKEKKAEALIKVQLKKSLYKPETYKPTETKIDSAFAPWDSRELLEAFYMLKDEKDKLDEISMAVKSAARLISIYREPFYSSFERYEYEEAKKNYDKAVAKLENQEEKIKNTYIQIASLLQRKKEFIGYKAIHSYRADNNAGNTLMSSMLFFFDDKMKEILYSLGDDDMQKIKEAMELFSEHMTEIDSK